MLLNAYRRFIILVDKLCFLVYVRTFKVVGREHIPKEGPLIVVSNHVNNADPPAVALAAPRYPMYMAKREMIGWPILGPAFAKFGAFPVRRGAADLAALNMATDVVESGQMLVMFPEGTRNPKGVLRKGHPGTAIVGLRTGAPIVPVAVTGTQSITWPWIFIKPQSVKQVTVTIGEPFRLAPVDKIDSEAAARATETIMRHIAALLPPEQRGIYASEPASAGD